MKEKEIKGLQTTVQQLSNRLEICEINLAEEKQNYATLKKEFDKFSSTESSYRWWVSFSKIQKFLQYSEPFYTPELPFCFQISAFCKNRVLEVRLYRCRGTNDKPNGQINTSLPGYLFQMYVIGEDGNKESKEAYFIQPNLNFSIDAGFVRSSGNGWSDFMSPNNWGTWLINNHQYIFCKIKKNF